MFYDSTDYITNLIDYTFCLNFSMAYVTLLMVDMVDIFGLFMVALVKKLLNPLLVRNSEDLVWCGEISRKIEGIYNIHGFREAYDKLNREEIQELLTICCVWMNVRCCCFYNESLWGWGPQLCKVMPTKGICLYALDPSYVNGNKVE